MSELMGMQAKRHTLQVSWAVRTFTNSGTKLRAPPETRQGAGGHHFEVMVAVLVA